MGPSKRSLPEEGEDESDNHENQKEISRKRRRSQQDTNPERGEDTDEDDEEEFIRASQAFTIENEIPRENAPAPYGTILAVTVENFMCHKLLEVTLGPFMNFIVGQNGSGKSAVLTALTLCLGGKASVTNRGTSIKNFIREGEHSAMIEVKIRNGGDGYKPDVYGDVIIVQRTFNRDGAGGYKVKSKLKKTISTRREELDDICEYMGLQIDNPMTVLSQDAARQFLNTATPSQKYTFFMKGVQLDQLYADYEFLHKSYTNISSALLTKDGDIKDLRDQADEAEKRFKTIKETENLRERVTLYIRKHAWSQVSNVEKDLNACKNSIAETEATLEQRVGKEADLSAQFDENQNEIQRASEEAASAVQKLEEIKEERDTYKEKEVDANRQALMSNQQDEREIHGNIRDLENKVKEIEKQEQEEHKRLEQAGSSGARLLETQAAKTSEKERLKSEVNDLVANHDAQKRALDASQAAVNQAKEKCNAKREEIRVTESRIRDLENSRNKALSAYGSNIQKLMDAISSARWRSKPIGPVGMYVKLLDEKWSSVLEKVLNSSLGSFIVANQDDKRQLQDLMKRTRCDAPISLFGDEPMELKEPPRDVLTVLRALEISNGTVMRLLVINNVIDQTVLIEDLHEAMDFMANPPMHARFCYALQQRPGWGFNVKGGQGAGGVTPIRPPQGLPKMTVNIDARVSASRDELAMLRQEMHDFESQKSDSERQRNGLDEEVRRFTKKKLDLTRRIQSLEDEIERIGAQIEDTQQDGKLAGLASQKEIQKEKIRHYTEQYEEVIVQKDNLNDKSRLIAQEMNKIIERLNEARHVAERSQESYAELEKQKEGLLTRMRALQREIDKLRTDIGTLNIRREELEASIETISAQATRIGERIHLERGETTEKLSKTLDSLNKSLEDADKRLGGTAGDIAEDFANKKKQYLDAQRELRYLKELQMMIKETWEERVKRWFHFRRKISFRARIQFNYYMSEREFVGQLLFKHENSELFLTVQTTQQANHGKRETKTLSGGEKSYSQICLLLALWDAMGSPFRCLDEFDVFMDAVNRGIAMQLIVKAASRSNGKQFILITPQDVSTKAFEDRQDVRIVRMRDPERNQGRLNFGNE